MTCFGLTLEKLRKENNEHFLDLANYLEVSTIFLAAVERGDRKVPDHWFALLGSHYCVDEKILINLARDAKD